MKKQQQPPTAASLLAEFGIGSNSTVKRILSRASDPQTVLASILELTAEIGTANPRKLRGTLVNYLGAETVPRAVSLTWARLTPAEWVLLWRAHEYGGVYRDTLPDRLQDIFSGWSEAFGDVMEEPFGQSLLDPSSLRAALTELDPPADFEIVPRSGALLDLQPENQEARVWLIEHIDSIRQAWQSRGVLHRIVVCPSLEHGENTAAREQPDPIWPTALCELRLQMTKATFDAWLRDSTLLRVDEDGAFVIGVKNRYAKEWLENRLMSTINRTLIRVTGENDVAVRFDVHPESESYASTST